MYLVVKDSHDCGVARFQYREVADTRDDAHKFMLDDLKREIVTRDWDRITAKDDGISLMVNDGLLDTRTDWFAVWTSVDNEWMVVRCAVHKGLKPEVSYLSGYNDYADGCKLVTRIYKERLADSRGGQWDPDRTWCCNGHARFSTEKKDVVVDIRLINTKQTYVGRSFKYAS